MVVNRIALLLVACVALSGCSAKKSALKEVETLRAQVASLKQDSIQMSRVIDTLRVVNVRDSVSTESVKEVTTSSTSEVDITAAEGGSVEVERTPNPQGGESIRISGAGSISIRDTETISSREYQKVIRQRDSLALETSSLEERLAQVKTERDSLSVDYDRFKEEVKQRKPSLMQQALGAWFWIVLVLVLLLVWRYRRMIAMFLGIPTRPRFGK